MSRRSKSLRDKVFAAAREKLQKRPSDGAIFWDVMHLPDEQGEHALVILGGAALEHSLESAILTHLIPMDENEVIAFFGPPQESPMTFDVKIRLAHALGIISDDAKADFKCIRIIRNVFAHAKTSTSFSDSVVADLCDQLKYADKIQWGGIVGPKPEDPKSLFINFVRMFFLYLSGAMNGGEETRVSYKTSKLSAWFS